MRDALNNNPVVQAAVVGVLGIVVAFLLITRVASQGGDEAEAPPAAQPTASSAATPPAAGAEASSTASAEAPSTTGAEPPAATTAPDPAADAAGGAAAVPAEAAEAFVAGPGLPREVVSAYAKGDVVVLLITRYRGIDDRKLEAKVEELRGRDDVALFTTLAVGVGRYSRIAQGVDVDRTPALVVIEPRRLADGPLPRATVSYGFRGAKSVEQAVRDALYSGGENLPAYPR